MRTRLLFAVPVLLLGFVALLFAGLASPGRDAQNSELARVLAQPPKLAKPETTKFISAARKVERRGFIRRKAGKVSAKGWVTVLTPSHGKDFKKSGDYRYQLHARGESIELHVGDKPKGGLVRASDQDEGMAFTPGQVVEVEGRPVSGGIDVERAEQAGRALLSPALGPVQTPRPAVVTHKVAVVRFYQPGQSAQLPTDATLQQALVTAPDSVQKYFLQLSSNQLALTFKTFPAVQAPTSTDCGQIWDYNAINGIQQQVDTAALATGDSLNNYDHIINIGASDPSCTWFGGGEAYFRNSFFRNTGTSGPGLGAFAHELGHNLGLAHSNSIIATKRGAPVSISKTKRKVEYGDSADLMGTGGGSTAMNAPQLARLGLLPVSRTRELTSADYGQSITLGSVSQDLAANTDPRLLRIRRASVKDPRAADAYLYLDLRQTDPRGLFDQFEANDPIIHGVGVRFGPSLGTGAIGNAPFSFDLLNSSPGRRASDDSGYGWNLGNERNMVSDPTGRTKVSDAQDFAVAAGQSMYDPQENLTISTETVGSGQASVRVTAGPPPGNPTNVSLVGSRLTVQAGAGRRNNVVLAEHEGQLTVVDVGNRVEVGAGCSLVDGQTATCSKTPITSAAVTLDAATDVGSSDLGAVYGDLKLPVTWDGGDGQDSLEGGPGDDTFKAGPGGSTGADADLFTGGGGNDRVVYSSRTGTQPVFVRNDNAPFADGGTSEGDHVSDDIAGATGGSGNDEFKLDPSRVQSINGGSGTDKIYAGSLADTIVSRDNASGDQVYCGGGADKLYRDAGDTLDGTCPASPAMPQIEFVSGPENGSVTNSANVSFGFFALWGSGITWTCKIENGTTPGAATPGACTSVSAATGTYTATAPTEGDKVLTVVGTIAGVSTSVSRTFRVDRTAPTVSITSAPAATTDASGSNFTFGYSDSSGSTKARFECSLDNAATWTSCGASVSYPELAPGTYRLIVRAVDEGGNLSPTQQHDWTVAYDTILDSAEDWSQDWYFPNQSYQFTAERPAFSFRATGTGATFWCKIDAAAWAQCSSATQPWRPTAPLDLSVAHTIQIAAGNATAPTDPTPLTFASGGGFYPTNINTRFTSGPAEGSWLTSTSATFGIEAYFVEYWHGRDTNIPVEVRKFECRLNSSGWFPCGSPFTTAGLPQGTNVFSARAVRDDGQRLDEDWTPTVRTFKVDSVAPATSFTAGPANNSWIAGPDTSFDFASNEAGSTLECKLDAGSWAPCTSPKSLTGLSTASHTFMTRATDAAGNVGAVTGRSFDVGAPHATITSGPEASSYTNNPTPTFTFTATHSTATFECAIGTSATPTYSACTSPWTVPTQPAGSNVFRVKAKLPTGQTDTSFSGRLVNFDYTAPAAATIDSGPAAGSTVTTDDVAFGFSVAGETSPTFECKLDSGSWAACTSPKTVAGLPNGARTWSVRAIDRAGNAGATTARTFTVAKAKVMTISSPAPATPSAVALTPGAIDWVKWNGNSPTTLSRKAGVNQISTWSSLMGTQPNTTFTGTTTYSWTDAAGTASGSSAAGVATGVANGRGFRFTVPATNATTRTLKVYVGLRGASVTDAIKVKFSDGVTQAVNLTSTSDTATARVYTVTFRPTAATDTLTVDWYQGGGSTKSTALAILYGAVLS